MIKFLYLLSVNSVIILYLSNDIECSKLSDALQHYTDQPQQHLESIWKNYKNAFDNEIASNLGENFGKKAMYILEPNRPEAHFIAGGFHLTDGVVTVHFFEMVLRELPILIRPKLDIGLSAHRLVLESKVDRMFIDTTYNVARNSSSLIYARPEDQKDLSPFSLQQVDSSGKVTIVAEDCLLSGISIATLSGDSVNLGHSTFMLQDCKFTVEISTPNSGAPPVIAPYFPEGPKEKLEMVLSKPLRDELNTKLQGAMDTYINMTSLLGSDKPGVASADIRNKQQELLKAYNDFTTEYVRNLNQKTLNANKGHLELPNYEIVLNTETDKRSWQCHMALRDQTLYGLDTAYVPHTGGPYGPQLDKAADVIMFNSMQIRGKITHDDGNGSMTYDFAAEIADVKVDVILRINQTPKLHNIRLTSWRSLEFSITPWETQFKERHGYQSLVYGYVLNELPVQVINYLTSVLGDPINGIKPGNDDTGGSTTVKDDDPAKGNETEEDKNAKEGNETEEDKNAKEGKDAKKGKDAKEGKDAKDAKEGKDAEKGKDANDKKQKGGFFSDDLDDNFFSDEKFFSDDVIEKDFISDDGIEKDFISDHGIEKDFISDHGIEKDFFSDDSDGAGDDTLGKEKGVNDSGDKDVADNPNTAELLEEGKNDDNEKGGAKNDDGEPIDDKGVGIAEPSGTQTDAPDIGVDDEDEKNVKEDVFLSKEFIEKDFFSDDNNKEDFISGMSVEDEDKNSPLTKKKTELSNENVAVEDGVDGTNNSDDVGQDKKSEKNDGDVGQDKESDKDDGDLGQDQDDNKDDGDVGQNVNSSPIPKQQKIGDADKPDILEKNFFSDGNDGKFFSDGFENDFFSDDSKNSHKKLSNEQGKVSAISAVNNTSANTDDNSGTSDSVSDDDNNEQNAGDTGEKKLWAFGSEEGNIFFDEKFFSDDKFDKLPARRDSQKGNAKKNDVKNPRSELVDHNDDKPDKSTNKEENGNVEDSQKVKNPALLSNVHNTRRQQNSHIAENEIS